MNIFNLYTRVGNSFLGLNANYILASAFARCVSTANGKVMPDNRYFFDTQGFVPLDAIGDVSEISRIVGIDTVVKMLEDRQVINVLMKHIPPGALDVASNYTVDYSTPPRPYKDMAGILLESEYVQRILDHIEKCAVDSMIGASGLGDSFPFVSIYLMWEQNGVQKSMQILELVWQGQRLDGFDGEIYNIDPVNPSLN